MITKTNTTSNMSNELKNQNNMSNNEKAANWLKVSLDAFNIAPETHEGWDMSCKGGMKEACNILGLLSQIALIKSDVERSFQSFKESFISPKFGFHKTLRILETFVDAYNNLNGYDKSGGHVWVMDNGKHIHLMWGDESRQVNTFTAQGDSVPDMVNSFLIKDIPYATSDELDRKVSSLSPEAQLLFRIFGEIPKGL